MVVLRVWPWLKEPRFFYVEPHLRRGDLKTVVVSLDPLSRGPPGDAGPGERSAELDIIWRSLGAHPGHPISINRGEFGRLGILPLRTGLTPARTIWVLAIGRRIGGRKRCLLAGVGGVLWLLRDLVHQDGLPFSRLPARSRQ